MGQQTKSCNSPRQSDGKICAPNPADSTSPARTCRSSCSRTPGTMWSGTSRPLPASRKNGGTNTGTPKRAPEQERQEKHERRLPDVIQRWRDQQDWWSTSFDPNAPAAAKRKTSGRGGYGFCDGDDCLQEIVTTAMRVRGTEIQLPPLEHQAPLPRSARRRIESAARSRRAHLLKSSTARFPRSTSMCPNGFIAAATLHARWNCCSRRSSFPAPAMRLRSSWRPGS